MTEESVCFINNNYNNVDVLLSKPLSATNCYFVICYIVILY